MADAQNPNDPTLKSEAQRLADAARDRAGDAIEEIKVASNQVVDKVRELIEEGNVRRVSIRKGERTLLEIPLTVGVGAGAGALLLNAPLAAIGALAALVADITLVIEREEDEAAPASTPPAAESDADVGSVSNANDAEPSPGDTADKTVGKPPAE